VDLLLDVAVTGINKVEREGVSVEHPASFVLIGSGNPEEGELRPQLLDRFGLHAEVTTENYLQNRVDVIVRREAYDRDRDAFCESFAAHQDQLRKRITRARANLTKVTVERPVLEKIAQLCADLKVDGHRGELTIMRASRALAAFEGRRTVTNDHVKRVSGMALRHRLRRDALDETATSEQIQQAVDEVFPNSGAPPPSPGNGGGDTQNLDQPGKVNKESPRQRRTATGSSARPNDADVLSPPAVDRKSGQVKLDEHLRNTDRADKSRSLSRRASGGKAALVQTRGRYTRAVTFRTAGARVAFDATLRALVCLDSSLRTGRLGRISSEALRYKQLKHKQGTLFVFAIDASGSMAMNRIARAKSTILKLLRKSYLNRDSVAIVSFHGTSANVDLPPSRSILRARRVLDTLRMGGSTPLGLGLVTTIELLELVGNKFGETVVLLFTDGRSNVPLRRGGLNLRAFRQVKIESELKELTVALHRTKARVIVVDTQKEFESAAETRRLASILRARFVKISPANP
jgi:magnesium chelatase subunit D